MDEIISFLPSYVGSKKHWVRYLSRYKGEHFVELFCGSAVLSANLAKTTILNDLDPYIYLILSKYNKLIVPEKFTLEDYYNYRSKEDWWRWAFNLQKMSFSGVFRHGRNGYNVPAKKGESYPKEVSIREDYLTSRKRWDSLKPDVREGCYFSVPVSDLRDKIVIFDPPYQKSQASYNSSKFNYDEYWGYIEFLRDANIAKTLIIFDRSSNLKIRKIPIFGDRTMCVNGKHGLKNKPLKRDVEAIAIFEDGKWLKPIQLELGV